MSVAILALDLAGDTGWARVLEDDVLESGVGRLKLRDTESPGERWKRAREWFRDMAAGVEWLAWERVVATSGPFAAGELFGLQAQLVEVAFDLKLQCVTVAPSTLKKFATGNGRAKKPEIVAAAKARWPRTSFETHDQADACFVLLWAQQAIAAARSEVA